YASQENAASNFNLLNDPMAQYNILNSDSFGGRDVFYEIAPIILFLSGMLFITLGMHGLRLRFGKGSGKIGNISLQISTLAGIAGSIAIIPMSFLFGHFWWYVWGYSLLFTFTGLLVFGITAMQRKSLPRWNALPLLVGIWYPALILVDLLDVNNGLLDLLRLTTLWISIIGTIALGYLLQSDSGAEMAAA
ncbi:MAG: hypothetical protein IH859_02520, partial [Chloroflexi bacterium]|nr:hypothetical protein [Chloroflexota bacterium]